MNRSPCPFCNLPSERVLFANLQGLVIRDGFPISPGHTLIVPRRHVPSFFDLDAQEREALFTLLNEAKRRLDRELKPDAYNVGINDGPAAGQTVPHLHIHLIPAMRATGPTPGAACGGFSLTKPITGLSDECPRLRQTTDLS